MMYYALNDDLAFPGRWFLNGLFDSAGQDIDQRVFTYGIAVGNTLPLWDGGTVETVTPLRVQVREAGTSLDFTFADFDLPVVAAELAAVICDAAPRDVQQFPLNVDGAAGEFRILNVTARLKCLNEAKSVYRWWTPADGDPGKVGQYMGVNPIIINRDEVADRDIFRIHGWEVVIIVSERIRAMLESWEATGVRFASVIAE